MKRRATLKIIFEKRKCNIDIDLDKLLSAGRNFYISTSRSEVAITKPFSLFENVNVACRCCSSDEPLTESFYRRTINLSRIARFVVHRRRVEITLLKKKSVGHFFIQVGTSIRSRISQSSLAMRFVLLGYSFYLFNRLHRRPHKLCLCTQSVNAAASPARVAKFFLTIRTHRRKCAAHYVAR